MKPTSFARWGTGLAALLAGTALVLLAACGQFNDEPAGRVTAKLSFPGTVGAAATASTPLLAGPDATCTTVECTEVKTVVVGAVVITHRLEPYTDADQVDDVNEDEIEDDILNAVVYFEIVPVNGVDEPVSFLIPPDAAGPWMLIGVGLRYSISTLGELQDLPDDAPIWFGFTYGGTPSAPQFLNDIVKDGDVLEMIMQPACTYLPNGLYLDPGSSCYGPAM